MIGLILVIFLVLLLFGGGIAYGPRTPGHYWGYGYYGGGGLGLILIVIVVLIVLGRL